MTSKTTSSIWKRIWRSTSRCVITPSETRISPSRRLSPCRVCMSRALEIGFRDLAGAEQQCSERMGIAADLGRYDDAVVEVNLAFVVPQLRGDAQRARLPAQVEELEDVVDAKLA